MKFLPLFFLLAAPLHAELLATFATTRGNVVVSLHFAKTPQTVANFITLAQATRSRIDPATGAVIRKPLYAGETFYRVLNDFSGKLAQTGSGTGTVTGGPGYTFRDEFDVSLRHGPYILAMQNDKSPHTNGSQIYFTGDKGFPDDVGRNTVFGSITEASHGVVDAILMAGNNLTTINSVSFQRTSPEAVAFDVHAQQLPECAGYAGNLEVKPGEYVKFLPAVPQQAGSFFLFSRSVNLQDWGAVNKSYQATGMEGNVEFIIDDGMAKRAFYHFATVTHPDALVPDQSLLEGQSLSFDLDGGRTMVFDFASQDGGTLVDSAVSGPSGFFVSSYLPQPYKAVWIMGVGSGFFRFNCVMNGRTATEVTGRCEASEWTGDAWSPIGPGDLTLTQSP